VSENKPVIIRKRNRKTPEVYAYINARNRRIWERQHAESEREIKEIEDHLEKHYSYREMLNMLAYHVRAEESQAEGLREHEAVVETLNEVLALVRILTRFGPDSTDYFIAKQLMSPNVVNEVQGLYVKAMDHQKRLQSRKAAYARLENDPKQYAKERVYLAWKDWQAGKVEYGTRNSQAAFASSMQKKWDILDNVRSIENWCRDWKNGRNIPLIEPAQ